MSRPNISKPERSTPYKPTIKRPKWSRKQTLIDIAVSALEEDPSLMDLPIKELDDMSTERFGRRISYGTWDRAKKRIKS